MALRLTDTCLWDEDWFIELPMEYKLLYMYIKDRCDYGGIWKPNKKIFQRICGTNSIIFLDDFLNAVNKDEEGEEKLRIIVLPNRNWLLVKFLVYQIGIKYKPTIGAHRGALKILLNNNIDLSIIKDIDFSNIQEYDNQYIKNITHPMGMGVDKGNTRTLLNIDINTDIDIYNKKKKKEEKKEEIKLQSSNIWIRLPNSLTPIPPPNDIQLGGIIQLMKITKQIDITTEQLNSLWLVFKSNLTGVKQYENLGDIHSHFMNWVKKIDFTSEEFKKKALTTIPISQPKIKL